MKTLLSRLSSSVHRCLPSVVAFLATALGAHAAFPAGTPVSPYLTGQNYWYNPPASIFPTIFDSGVRIIRIGGHQPDLTVLLTNDQLLAEVDNIRSIGAEPLVQVSRSTTIDAAAVAASAVNYLNVVNHRGVKFWSIGNEPDISESTLSESDLAVLVGNYTRAIAPAMRDVDPTIKIYAADMAWYSTTKFSALLGGAADITGRDSKGRFYIDGIDFHRYPFGSTMTRSGVLNEMHSGLESAVVSLLNRIAYANALNGRVGDDALVWGLTEYNMTYANPSTATNNPAGLGVSSFLNGQFFAEYLRVGMKYGAHHMNTWSMLEGGGSGSVGDLGYLGGDWNSPIKRSSYYHLQMVADYLIPGGYLPATSSASDLVAISTSSPDQSVLSVMLLNEDNTADRAFSLRLNNDPVLGGGTKINVPAGLATEVSGTLDTQSTAVLLFDASGALKQRSTYSLARYAQNLPPIVETFSDSAARPGRPYGLTVSSGDAKAVLMWQPASEATAYSIKRSTVSGGPYTTLATGVMTTSYTDFGLTNGSTYYYVITANNGVGESCNSDEEVVALPMAAVPEVATSLEAESLTRTSSAGVTTVINSDTAASGGKWVQLNASAIGNYMEFTTPSLPAGTYQLKLMYKSNSSRGKLNFSVDGSVVGALDEYTASTNATYPTASIGSVTFASAGAHVLRMTVTGRNSGTSSYLLSADKFSFVSQAAIATATVTLGNLDYVYDGTPKSATAQTSPAGLATVITYDGSTTAPTAPGAYTVVARIAAAGYVGSSSGTLYIRDVTPPVLTVPQNITVEATSAAGATVTYAASAVDDIDGAVPVTYSVPSGSTFPLGSTSVTVSARDAAGNVATGLFTVTVRDTTAPVIASIVPSVRTIWPPNRKMVSVTLTPSVSDAVGVTGLKIVSVSTNEPDATVQWQITGALSVSLLADRLGGGTGRVYTITVEASDAAGNASTKSVVVSVPHDQSGE